MQIKIRKMKTVIKLLVILAALECAYLYAFPAALNIMAQKKCVKDFVVSKINGSADYSEVKFKTHLLPELSIYADYLKITEENNDLLLNANNIHLKISLLPLLVKKLNFKNIYASDLYINLKRNEDGSFNIEKILKKNKRSFFKLNFKKSNININQYKIDGSDYNIDDSLSLTGVPLILQFDKKGNSVNIKTKGNISSHSFSSDFDIDMNTKTAFSLKDMEKNAFNGSCFIYNLDLKPLLPFLQKYVDEKISDIAGIVDYIQISTRTKDNNTNEITLNSQFNNVVFNKSNWENYIDAKGANKVNITAELSKDNINVSSFSYKADNVNIKSGGNIDLSGSTPVLDITAEVKESRTENIASILPPTLVPKLKTIENIKKYGIFGDIEGKVDIKGKIPQPDITGYANGNNIHILDESFHKLHTGTVKLTFDKRILNMDIDIDLPDNQKAEIDGYVYMYRDGLNNVNIKTTGNIDFPLAQKLVVPISKVFNFLLGPIPDMDITKGKGIIDINVQGSIDVIKINGYCSFRDTKLTYNGLYGEIKDGKGRLDFKDDIIKFKSEKAFVKNNLLNVDGTVKINDNMDFNITADNADSVDVMEIINNSPLLKDVKEGLGILTSAAGAIDLFVNIKANIVPVPYGQPPLPPEEAFTDMKVNGYAVLNNNSCTLEGFRTPITKLLGTVKFTEELVDLNGIKGVVGTSPIEIAGTVLTDINTKIPDVDILITSGGVNLKDTIKFLTESYLYPADYPDLSPLYTIDSKHDLYFKYKAKAIDFITDKAYAVMNFIDDNNESALKAKSGKIILDKSTVKVENVTANLFDSLVNVNGHVDRVDTLTPVYNLKVQTDKFNLANLNNLEKLSIVPAELKQVLSEFDNYGGFAKADISVKKNTLSGCIKFNNAAVNHIKTNLPVKFDDFPVTLKENKVHIENMTAYIGNIPVYTDVTISDIYKKPVFSGYFTSKLTDEFIHSYIFSNLAEKIKITGDINLSAKFEGTEDNMEIYPKLTLNPYADITVENNSIGEITDKREFSGTINFQNDKINIKNLDYVKYISSQNNRVYPITFASANALLKKNGDNIIEPEEINLKTNRNITARVLNLLLKQPLFKQGALSCDLKYKVDKVTKTAQLLGKMECRNLDIPLFDTVIKNIRLRADNENIIMDVMGFISDSRININSIIKNSINPRPEFQSLNINVEAVDNDKLLQAIAKTHNAMNKNNQMKHFDLNGLKINNGSLNIKQMTIKSMNLSNVAGDFSIDENGIFNADNISIDVEKGNIRGKISYNLNTTDMEGDFSLDNVDANYVTETLFEGKNQIYGKADGTVILKTKGTTNDEIIKNLSGAVLFDINDGRMPKLGSLEYLLRASNIIKGGITGFTINNILELLNLVKSGYFSNINGNCVIKDGIAQNIEIYSKGDNMSLYIHGSYDISQTHADMEVLGKISKQISTILGAIGNTSINTFFKLIPGISLLDFGRKNFIEDVEKIPPFTGGYYDSRTFQAVINGNINESGYVQSFKWVQ